MDYQLENLGADRFQLLVQALLAGENSGVVCFPIGQPDGGRDALFRPAQNMEGGFTVVQVKFSREPHKIDDIRKWILDKLDGEKPKIERLIERGATKYVLVTNVSGTGHLDSGSIDTIHRELATLTGLETQCWWRDDINRRLDGNWDVKLRYPETLSGHDFFRLLLQTTLGQHHERRLNALRAFLASQFDDDVEVKFKQVELHNKLLDLFVDLPFRVVMNSGAEDSLARYHGFPSMRVTLEGPEAKTMVLTAHDEDNATNTGTATLLLSDFGRTVLRQAVVEGAPGQGKSTLAQYVCQVHRIRLLNKETEFDKLPDQDRHSPLLLPFKVDLRDLAAWLGGADPFTAKADTEYQEPRTLETFLARLVMRSSGGVEFDVNDLLESSKLFPLLVVLDGLDEVADIKQRADVVAAVTKAIPRLRENCRDFGVIITSRPAAFANSPGFDAELFPYIELLSVSRSQINDYANRWMNVRGLAARERVEFQEILTEKLNAPHLRDLARNPMQLTILLSLILTQGSALPDKRTSLYDAYVELFFSREAAKSVSVRKHIALLKDLHRYLGWVLHSTTETSRRKSSGRISAEELKDLLLKYLKREQHDTSVVDEIFGTMLERVVMIVPRVQGTYEFEVQPLREYFAARYLYDTASYSPPGNERKGTKPDRFDAIARNFYWLNVVRFFCGCFSKGELLDLADRVKELVLDPTLGKSRHPVSLSAMLLSDWVFAQSPKAVTQLVDALTNEHSIRRLAPPSTISSRGTVIQVPVLSGGRRILASTFSYIESDGCRRDQATQVAQVLKAHASEEQLSKRWLESPLSKTDALRWLQVGLAIGTLQTVSVAQIHEKIGITRLERRWVSVLWAARRFDCIISSPHNASLFLNHALSSPIGSRPNDYGRWPFFLVAYLLGHSYYLSSEYLARFVEVYEKEKLSRDFADAPEFVNQAVSISDHLANSLRLRSNRTSRTLLLEDSIELCRQAWGTRPAILSAAYRLVARTRAEGRKRTKKAVDPLDAATPICTRIRTADFFRRDVNWWRGQFGRPKLSSANTSLLLTLCILLAPTSALIDLNEELSSAADSLSDEDWTALATNITSELYGGYSFQSRKHGATLDQLPLIRSDRLAYLIGLKSPALYARAIFLERFASDNERLGRSTAVLEFRQSLAVECALSGLMSWDAALEVVRTTYQGGAAYQVEHLRKLGSLPESVSAEVLQSPKVYPVALWDAAEGAMSRISRKSVRAVGVVAKAERWFSGQ